MADTQTCEYEVVRDDWKIASEDGRRISEWMSKLGMTGDEEASLTQLERLAFMLDWGPILALPIKSSRGRIRPAIDENGDLDWGAFGTVDFQRLQGPFDIARCKADKLQAEVRHNALMLETLAGRVALEAQNHILALGRAGRLDLDLIDDADEWMFARRYLRIRRLRNEIRELRELSWRRRWLQ